LTCWELNRHWLGFFNYNWFGLLLWLNHLDVLVVLSNVSKDLVNDLNLARGVWLDVFNDHVVMAIVSTVVDLINLNVVDLFTLLVQDVILVHDIVVLLVMHFLLEVLSLHSFLSLILFSQLPLSFDCCMESLLHGKLFLLKQSKAMFFFLLKDSCLFSFPLTMCLFLADQTLMLQAVHFFKSLSCSLLFFSCTLLSNQPLLLFLLETESFAFSLHFDLLLAESFLDQSLTLFVGDALSFSLFAS
jgi:hypothetical protein